MNMTRALLLLAFAALATAQPSDKVLPQKWQQAYWSTVHQVEALQAEFWRSMPPREQKDASLVDWNYLTTEQKELRGQWETLQDAMAKSLQRAVAWCNEPDRERYSSIGITFHGVLYCANDGDSREKRHIPPRVK